MVTKIVIIDQVRKDWSGSITGIDYTIGYKTTKSKNAEDFIKSTYEPKSGDVLFFTKDCTVPRFKVKSFCEKYNTSVTRNKDKATATFISNNIMNTHITNHWGYHCTIEKFENHIKKTPYSYDAYLMNFRKTIETEGVNEIFFFYYNSDAFDINGFKLDIDNCNVKFCSQENFNLLRDLFVNKNVYMQDDILKVLNQDVVIDTEMYKQLSSMLENGETSNVKIAMEIMANSDYEKSAPYLLLLFMNYGYRIWDSGFRNHVNFKSLVEFFDLNGRRNYTHIDLDEIVNVLKAKKFLTPESINMLMPLAYDQIRDRVSLEHFKVSKISFVENPTEENDEEILNIEEDEPAF
jgi:hypothetical protein